MTDGLERALGRIEGKLDTYIEGQKQREAVQDTRLNGHSMRISKVERKQRSLISFVGGASFILGLVVGFIRLVTQ